jgi:hypothetical protein
VAQWPRQQAVAAAAAVGTLVRRELFAYDRGFEGQSPDGQDVDSAVMGKAQGVSDPIRRLVYSEAEGLVGRFHQGMVGLAFAMMVAPAGRALSPAGVASRDGPD